MSRNSDSTSSLQVDGPEQNPHFTVLWPGTREFNDVHAPYRGNAAPVTTKPVSGTLNNTLLHHAAKSYASSRKEPSALLRALQPSRRVPAVSLTRPIFEPAEGPGPGAYSTSDIAPVMIVSQPVLSSYNMNGVSSKVHSKAAEAVLDVSQGLHAIAPHKYNTFISKNRQARQLNHNTQENLKATDNLMRSSKIKLSNKHTPNAQDLSNTDIDVYLPKLYGKDTNVLGGAFTVQPRITVTAEIMNQHRSGYQAQHTNNTDIQDITKKHVYSIQFHTSSTGGKEDTSFLLENHTTPGPGAYYDPFKHQSIGNIHLMKHGGGVEKESKTSSFPKSGRHLVPEQVYSFEAQLLHRSQLLKRQFDPNSATNNTDYKNMLSTSRPISNARVRSAQVCSKEDALVLLNSVPGHAQAQLRQYIEELDALDNTKSTMNTSTNQQQHQPNTHKQRVKKILHSADPAHREEELARKAEEREQRQELAKRKRLQLESMEKYRRESTYTAMGIVVYGGEQQAVKAAWQRTIVCLLFLRKLHMIFHVVQSRKHKLRIENRAVTTIQACVRKWQQKRIRERQDQAARVITKAIRKYCMNRQYRRKKWASQVLLGVQSTAKQQEYVISRVSSVRNACIKIQRWWRSQQQVRKLALIGPHYQLDALIQQVHNRYITNEMNSHCQRKVKKMTSFSHNHPTPALKPKAVNVPFQSKELRHSVLLEYKKKEETSWVHLVRGYIHRYTVWHAQFVLRKTAYEVQQLEQRQMQAEQKKRLQALEEDENETSLFEFPQVVVEGISTSIYQSIQDVPLPPKKPYRRKFLPKATLIVLQNRCYDKVEPPLSTKFRQKINTLMQTQQQTMQYHQK